VKKEAEALLKNKKEMRSSGFFCAETENTADAALLAGGKIEYFLYCEDAETAAKKYLKGSERAIKVQKSLIDRYSDVKAHRGFIAVIKARDNRIKDIKAVQRGVVLDNIQDPANIGAIVRSGAAFGFTGYLLVDCAAFISEKTARASAGAVFFAEYADVSFEDIEAAKDGCEFITTAVKGGEALESFRLPAGRFMPVLGNEGHGVSKRLEALASGTIRIDYPGKKVESLNVSAAAAILFYEMARKERV